MKARDDWWYMPLISLLAPIVVLIDQESFVGILKPFLSCFKSKKSEVEMGFKTYS